MLARENGNAVGANLVGSISVGGYAVSTDDYGLNPALAHEVGGHVVAENGRRNVVLHQLPGCKAGTLQIGTRLIGEDVDLMATLHRGTDHAQRRAIAARGESTGIAMGEDSALLREQVSSERAQLLTGGDVFVIHLPRECDHLLLNLRDRSISRGELVVEVTDFANAPEKVDGGGAGARQGVADDGDFCCEIRQIGSVRAVNADRYAHGA